MTKTKVIGPAMAWEPNSVNKTITIKAATWKRLQKHGNSFGSTYDSIITDILDRVEKRESNKEERAF
jgi:macrodomain Ter protein organizer (MatP/YcbG family)